MNEYDLDLHWHALNYRMTHTADADRCWRELEACVDRLVAKSDKTCQHCKHWGKDYAFERLESCKQFDVRDMFEADGYACFEPPADFGCNRWEAKV